MNTNNEAASDASESTQGLASTAAPCEARARYEAAAQALSEALGRKRAMSERVAKMVRAAEAAQTQANAAREEYRGTAPGRWRADARDPETARVGAFVAGVGGGIHRNASGA